MSSNHRSTTDIVRLVASLSPSYRYEAGRVQLEKAWRAERDAIKPHYDGSMPDYLEKAYPGESPDIRQYRKENFVSITQPLVHKAFSSFYRFFSKSKYSINIQNEQMREYIAKQRFEGLNLDDYHFKKIFTNKGLDPNAVCVVMPQMPIPLSNNERLESIEIHIVSSEHILYASPFLQFKARKNETIQIAGEFYQVDTYVVTDEHYGFTGRKIDGTAAQLGVIEHLNQESEHWYHIYSHNLGYVPYFVLGSQERYVKDEYGERHQYYINDFKSAIPSLQRAITYENNFFGVSMKMGHPHKRSFEVDCNSCGGRGEINKMVGNELTQKACGDCGGTGKQAIGHSPIEGSTLATIDLENEKQLNFWKDVSVIDYTTAPYQNIDQMREWFDYYYEIAKDVLNVDKLIKQAQSAVAKEADREESSIEIENIAEDWYSKLQKLYNIIQGLLFLDIDNPVKVMMPADFTRKSQHELFQEFKETVTQQMPMDIRRKAYFDYLQRRFPNDTEAHRLAKVKVMYAPFCLMSDVELRRPGHDNEKAKAMFVDTVLYRISQNQETSIANLSNNELFKLIDEEIKQYLIPPRVDLENINDE